MTRDELARKHADAIRFAYRDLCEQGDEGIRKMADQHAAITEQAVSDALALQGANPAAGRTVKPEALEPAAKPAPGRTPARGQRATARTSRKETK